MEFNVSLEQFEGPLDLMLHLVHASKLDLFSLNLDDLAGQYLAYIRKAMDKGLDVSSEYLVEFTSLMEYKSKALLPRRQSEENADPYEEDPSQRMARRLREYEKCKQEALLLALLHEKRERQYDREPASQIDEWMASASQNAPLKLKSGDLQKAFLRVMRRYELMQPYQTKVEVKELSVEERMEQILQLPWTGQEAFRFEKLLEDTSSLHEAVVSFLALLELVHEGLFSVWCSEKDEIWIQKLAKAS